MKIALLQITSGLDYKINLAKIDQMLSEVVSNGVDTAFLPEAFYSISDGLTPTPYTLSEKNEHFQHVLDLARSHKVNLLGGSAATRIEDKILNRIYNISADGALLQTYDKIHLFACNLSNDPSKQILDEGRIYTGGNTPKILSFRDWSIGQSICFDLRFPELFRHYFLQGANVLSISSAFTYVTGKAHWHTLLKARAIENQSYVVACNQWGQHNERMRTYGHSLVVDPWGEILVDAGEGEKVVYADLEMSRLKEIRSRMNIRPTINHL